MLVAAFLMCYIAHFTHVVHMKCRYKTNIVWGSGTYHD